MAPEQEPDFTMQAKDILLNPCRQYVFVKETEDGQINVAAVDGPRMVELAMQAAETRNDSDSAMIRIENPDQEITLEPSVWLEVIKEVQSLIGWGAEDDDGTQH